jgi:hypothetical protein
LARAERRVPAVATPSSSADGVGARNGRLPRRSIRVESRGFGAGQRFRSSHE